MAKNKIEVIFDDQTGQMMLGAPMNDQAQKDYTVRMLLSAIKIVLDFKPSVIQPAQSVPSIARPPIPLKVTH